MYLVLSWKKTLYWISLDISKLFCKTLLFTRKKKDKLEEAIFKSPQIQTRSKVFFFRLEKKPERRKKNTLVSFHRHHNHPPSPRSETSISKITRRTRPREKKRRERSSFKGEERSYFIPIGRNPPPTFLFNSRGIDRPPSPPLPYFPPLPRPPRIPKWKKSLRVPATTRFKRQLYKNNIDPGIRRGWRVRDPGFQPSIYIYIYTLLCGFYRRERNVDILRSSKESLPLSLSMGRGDLLVWFFLYRRNTTQRAVLFLHRITGTALNSRVSWEFGCIGAARVLAVTSLSFSIFLKGIDGGWNFSDWSGSWT